MCTSFSLLHSSNFFFCYLIVDFFFFFRRLYETDSEPEEDIVLEFFSFTTPVSGVARSDCVVYLAFYVLLYNGLFC